MEHIVNNWKTVVFERYAQFTGRAGRAEYWWYVLVAAVVGIVLSLLAQASTLFVIVYVIWGLATLIPGLAVAVRRLHDTDKSGWWVLIALIPIVGAIILIVFLATQGSYSSNQYGNPVPYGS